MEVSMKCRVWLGVGVGLAALSATGCVLDARGLQSEGGFERTLSVGRSVELDVRTGSGTIRVHTGSPGAVRVRGRVRCVNVWAGLNLSECVRRVEMAPPIDQSGDVIRLGDFHQPWTWGGVRIDFDVTVPPAAQVRTRSGSGDQIVDSVEGPVEASAGSGDIRIGRASGSVNVSTGSGRIELDGSEGPVLARAASGSITAVAVKGDIEVHAASGRVTVTQAANGRTDVTSASGSIRVSNLHGPLRLRTASGGVIVNGEPVDVWNVRAASGDVTMEVNADAGFTLDARTGSGRIRSEHPVMMTGRLSPRKLSGQIRGGGPRVEIATASGSISVR
jgi:DUF4097 and DUF4098 domain-containing protein YvlB